MTVDTLREILDKLHDSSSATQVVVFVDGTEPTYYNKIISVSSTSDGRVIINVE